MLKRVDAMASGIQIIAENIDSMNDLRKDLEDVPSKIQANSVELSDQIGIVLSYVDGTKGSSSANNGSGGGRQVTSDEYGQVTNLIEKMEDKTSEKLCEFGSLVESLQESIVRRIEKMEGVVHEASGNNKSDRSYIATLLDISEKLIECVKSVERTQKKELLPAIQTVVTATNKAEIAEAFKAELPFLRNNEIITKMYQE